jgi:hypothetical protein
MFAMIIPVYRKKGVFKKNLPQGLSALGGVWLSVRADRETLKSLEQVGWRFFDDEKGQANIFLKPNVKLFCRQFPRIASNTILHLNPTSGTIHFFN